MSTATTQHTGRIRGLHLAAAVAGSFQPRGETDSRRSARPHSSEAHGRRNPAPRSREDGRTGRMTGIAESLVEEAALACLDELGYGIASGPETGPGGSAPERGSYRDVLLAG